MDQGFSRRCGIKSWTPAGGGEEMGQDPFRAQSQSARFECSAAVGSGDSGSRFGGKRQRLMASALPVADKPDRFERTEESLTSLRKVIGYILGIVVPVLFWYAPIQFDTTAKHAVAVSSFMIIAWITETLPHALTGL